MVSGYRGWRVGVEYLHVLIFECAGCSQPLSSVRVTEFRNLEPTDGELFSLKCPCGWEADVRGFEARRHWVTEWWPSEKRLLIVPCEQLNLQFTNSVSGRP